MRSLLIAVVLGMAWNVSVAESVVSVTNNPSNAVSADEWGSPVRDVMGDYINERGWNLGIHPQNPSGAYLGFGEAFIQTEPSDVRYGRARIAAVTTATVNAIGEFAFTLSRDIAVDTYVETFRDEAAIRELEVTTTDSLLRALRDRVSTLSVAALDEALKRMGADPGRLPDYSRSEKVAIAHDLLQRDIVRRASAAINGVRVVATFEDADAVGVLVIHHRQLEQLASDIIRKDFQGRDQSNLQEILDVINNQYTSEDLVFQHGVRVIHDDAGVPAIISYGMSSPAVAASDSQRRIRMAVSQSRQVADVQADAGIAEFLNSAVFAESAASITAAEFESAQAINRGLEYSSGAVFYEDIRSMIRQQARAEITGVTTVRRWQENHPETGHLYVGVVKLWTPSQHFQYSPPTFQNEDDGSVQAEEPERQDELRTRARSSTELFEEG